MTTEPRSDISPLQRALDELELSIRDTKGVLADVLRGAVVRGGSGAEAQAAGDRLNVRFERVREELRKYLPQQLALRARDLLDKDLREAMGEHPVTRSCEWVDAVRDFLQIVAGARIDSPPDEATPAGGPSDAVSLARTVIGKYGADADKPSVHLAKALIDGAHNRDRVRAHAGARIDACHQIERRSMRGSWASPAWYAEIAAASVERATLEGVLHILNSAEDTVVHEAPSGGADMIRGLVRCAESAERMGGGALWDDTSRKALEAARAAGWGNNKVGRLDGRPGVDEVARAALADLVERADRDVRRYSRLRILGVAPSGTKQLEAGSVLRFQNLDDFVDADIKAHPNRGEAIDDVPSPTAGIFGHAPAVRDQPWVAALKHADAIRRDVERGLTSAQIRDEIIGKVGMMASARTPEMQARYDAALERERLDAQPDPTQESVNRQVQHDLAVTAARMVIDNPDAVRKLNPADFRRMATIVLAACKHHHFESHPLAGRRCLVCRTDAADIPPRRHVVLTEEQLSMALKCSVDEWSTSATATEGTLFDLWCNHVGVTANTYESTLAYAAFRAARDYFRTTTPLAVLDDTAIDRILYAVCELHDTSDLWTHSRRDPEAFRSVVRRAIETRPLRFDAAAAAIRARGGGPVAELVYEVPPAPLVVDEPPTLQDRQEALATALDEMRRALMTLRLEVSQSVADEMLKRFEAVVEAFRRRHAGPSAELVALRFFHDNVSARCRKMREVHLSTTYTELDMFVRDVLDNGGQALMKPRQLDAITVTLSGTAPATTTGGTVVSAGTWTEMPPVTVTKGTDGTLSVGPPPDGRPISEHLDDLSAGSNKRTPEQRVIDYARRVVSRGIHNRRTLDEMMRGKDLNLLHNDLQGLIWLAEAVTALDKEKP